MTFLELQDEALSDDFDATKYRARVKRWLNEAAGRIRRRMDVPDAEQVTDVALAAGVTEYSLPTDQVRLGSVHLMDPWTELSEVEPDDLDPGTTTSGSPSVFALRGGTLTVDPPPSADGTLRLRYWASGATLTGDSDAHELPEAYEDLLVTYARSRLFRAEDDFEAAAVYMAEFKAELAEMRADLQRPSRASRRQVPGMWATSSARPRFVRP